MTVADLIMELEHLDPDMEVRIASQPSWPFEYSIRGIIAGDELGREGCEDKVYIVEGSQLGYFTKDAWNMT